MTKRLIFFSIFAGIAFVIWGQYLEGVNSVVNSEIRDNFLKEYQILIVCAIAVYAIICQYLIFKTKENQNASKQSRWIDLTLFTIFFCAGVFWNCIGQDCFSYETNGLHFIFGALVMAATETILLFARTDERPINIPDLTLMTLVVALAPVAFIKFGNQSSEYLYGYSKQFRWTGIWRNPNTAGFFMGIGIIAAFALCWKFSDEKITRFKMRIQAVLIFSIIIMFLQMNLTLSRGAMLGTGFAAVYFLLSTNMKRENKRRAERKSQHRRISLCLLLVVMLMITGWLFSKWSPLAHRFHIINESIDFSVINRITAWIAGFQAIGDNPLGYGWNGSAICASLYQPFSQAVSGALDDNDFLIMALSLGLVPTIAFFVFTLQLFFNNSKSSNSFLALRAILMVFLTTAFFNGTVLNGSTGLLFWVVLGICRAAAYIEVL